MKTVGIALLGVSATHLDWTMVPYVKKSFFKHYKEGLKYLGDIEDVEKYCRTFSIDDELSIEDEKYKQNHIVYKYALDMTEKETHQAVEGMYHNLNY